MIPVRENSEVVIIYPDIWLLPCLIDNSSCFSSIYGIFHKKNIHFSHPFMAAPPQRLLRGSRQLFAWVSPRRLRDMGCVKRHHEVENFNKSDVHGDLSIGGFQVIGPFLHVAMVTRGSPFFFRNPCFIVFEFWAAMNCFERSQR